MESFIIQVLLNTMESIVILSGFLVLSRRHQYIKTKKIRCITFISIYPIYSILLSDFLPKGFDTISIILSTVLLLTLLFNSNTLKILIKSCLIFCGIFLIESIAIIIFMLIFGTDTQEHMAYNSVLMITTGSFIKSIELIVVYILYKTDFWSTWLDEDGTSGLGFWQMLVIVASCGAIIVTIIIAMCINNSIKLYYGVSSIIICMVMFFAMLMTFKEVRNLERMKYENIAVQKSVAQMKEFNDLMAKERHEYKNHLSTIYGLCCLRKQDTFDRIKSYIDEYASSKVLVNFNSNSGNDFVDAILNVKYNNALHQSIKIQASFENSLEYARINQHIIATIIANITQNAVEAITLAGMTDRYINISGKIVGENYEILISNNGPIISYDIQKRIFDSGFSTKSKSDEDRGFGLSIVKNHIEACNGTVIISSTEQETRFIIRLPLNKSKKYKQTNLIQTKENWI